MHVLVSDIFFCEKYKNFAGIKFTRSGRFEYFLKLFLYSFSQNPRNRQKSILLKYIGFSIFQ